MKKEELLRELNKVFIEVKKIVIENEGASAHLYTRLLHLKYDINHDKFDAINFADVLSIDLMGCKSYKELRDKTADSYQIVRGFHNLSIAVFNRDNEFRGEYIMVNN